MSSNKRAHAWAATLVVSLANLDPAVAQDEAPPAEAPPAEPKAAAAAAKPEDKPKPKPKPKALVVPPAPAKPVAADDATRLRRVEAALRGAGLLEDSRKKELAELKEQLTKVEDQKKSLEAAIKGGLDAESVKPALLGLTKKEAELKEKLGKLEAEQPASSEATAKSALSERLEALEASVAALQKQPAAPAPAAAKESEPSPGTATSEEPAHPAADEAKAKKDEAKPIGRAGWKDGFFIESEDGSYSLRPSGFLDFKLSYATHREEPNELAFSVPYARLALKGNLFSKALKYNVTTDFAKGNAVLTYFFGDYSFIPDYLALRAGQQKRPFSRLYIGPSEKSQFINASSAVKAFGDATDLGVVLHNGQPRFEYALGVFNGQSSKSVLSGDVEVEPMTGEGEITSGGFSNVPARFQPGLVARVATNYGKIEGYSEADFEGGPLRASLGAAGYVAFDMDRDDKSAVRGTIDGLLKVEGLAVSAAGFIASKQTGDELGDREREATGLVLQVGYLATKHVEPVVRYSFVAPKGADNDAHEVTGGLNLYFYKHSLKWMNDVVAKVAPQADETTTDYAYESQLQLMF